MLINTTNPIYYHREYTNDIGRSTDDPSLSNQCKRVALVALPFISLYKPAGFALSLGAGSLRLFSHTSLILHSSMANLPYHLLHLTISSASVAATLLAHPLGMLLATGQDLLLNTSSVAQSLYHAQYTDAFTNSAHLLNNALYMSLLLSGGLKLAIASLSMQVLLGLYHSQQEFQKGHWLEGCGHLGMATIRFQHLYTLLPNSIDNTSTRLTKTSAIVFMQGDEDLEEGELKALEDLCLQLIQDLVETLAPKYLVHDPDFVQRIFRQAQAAASQFVQEHGGSYIDQLLTEIEQNAAWQEFCWECERLLPEPTPCYSERGGLG